MDAARLALVLEVQELYSRYCNAVDMLDADAFAGTFTPNGLLEIAGGAAGRGRAEIAGMARVRAGEVMHYVSNVLVGSAHGDFMAACAHFTFVERGRAAAGAYGVYDDEIVRQHDGSLAWRRKRIIYLSATPEYARVMGIALPVTPADAPRPQASLDWASGR
jgi:hypothetical protein